MLTPKGSADWSTATDSVCMLATLLAGRDRDSAAPFLSAFDIGALVRRLVVRAVQLLARDPSTGGDAVREAAAGLEQASEPMRLLATIFATHPAAGRPLAEHRGLISSAARAFTLSACAPEGAGCSDGALEAPLKLLTAVMQYADVVLGRPSGPRRQQVAPRLADLILSAFPDFVTALGCAWTLSTKGVRIITTPGSPGGSGPRTWITSARQRPLISCAVLDLVAVISY